MARGLSLIRPVGGELQFAVFRKYRVQVRHGTLLTAAGRQIRAGSETSGHGKGMKKVIRLTGGYSGWLLLGHGQPGEEG